MANAMPGTNIVMAFIAMNVIQPSRLMFECVIPSPMHAYNIPLIPETGSGANNVAAAAKGYDITILPGVGSIR